MGCYVAEIEEERERVERENGREVRKDWASVGEIEEKQHALWECGLTLYAAEYSHVSHKVPWILKWHTGWLGDTKVARWALACVMGMNHIVQPGSVICDIHIACRWTRSRVWGYGYPGWALHFWVVQSHSIVMLLPESYVGSRYRKCGIQEQAGVMGAASKHLVRMLNRRLHGLALIRGCNLLCAWGLWSRSGQQADSSGSCCFLWRAYSS